MSVYRRRPLGQRRLAGRREPGLEFFQKLNKAGNFVPVIAKQATVAKGETPVIMRWDYNALADRDALAGNPTIEVVIPKTASWPASTSRPSAPTRRIRTPPSCGWSTSTRTKAS